MDSKEPPEVHHPSEPTPISLAQQLDQQSQEITDRHQGIESIAEKVQCIREIYRDLSMLVAEQGETIDLMENNCENTATKTKQGLTQLQEAAQQQRRCTIM